LKAAENRSKNMQKSAAWHPLYVGQTLTTKPSIYIMMHILMKGLQHASNRQSICHGP